MNYILLIKYSFVYVLRDLNVSCDGVQNTTKTSYTNAQEEEKSLTKHNRSKTKEIQTWNHIWSKLESENNGRG